MNKDTTTKVKAEQESDDRQRAREEALEDLSAINQLDTEPAPQEQCEMPATPAASANYAPVVAAHFDTTDTPELREIATLAYRVLEDAYRVISAIDGDDTHEQWELDLLAKRVKDIASSLFVVLRIAEQIKLDLARTA